MTSSVKGPDQIADPVPRAAGLPDHLLVWLEAVQRRVAHGLDAEADEPVRRIPQRRLRILQLVPSEGARQKDLAERALVTKQSIAELVDGLEADGLVERTPDPRDRRAWLVVRTPEGQRVSDSLNDAMNRVEEELARVVGPAHFEEFMSVLRRLGEDQI